MGTIGVSEGRAAQLALRQFVQALRRGDFAEAGSLMYGPTADRLGVPRGAPAARAFKERWSIPESTLRALGPTETARVLEEPDDPNVLVAFGLIISTVDEMTRPATLITGPRTAYVLALIETPNGWRVWGQPSEEEWRSARLVELAMLPGGD